MVDNNLNTEIDTDDHVPLDSGTDVSTEREGRDLERSRDHTPARDRQSRTRPSVRDTIRQSFNDARDDSDIDERPSRDIDRSVDSDLEAEPQERPQSKKEIAAPTSWTKDAKEAWTSLPDRIKQEVTKREVDMQKGVDALKKQYTDIDEAIAPYNQVIKQFQKTPAQAVSQLFAWFDALARDPDRAFPALLQSYKYEPARLLAAYGIDPRDLGQFIQYRNALAAQQQQQNQAQQGQAQEEVSPAVRQYIDGLHNELAELKQQVGHHFNGFAEQMAAQNQAKTQEMLDRWSADKPYFDQVRVMMGHLLTPDPQSGQAPVPLKDGRVDLDEAYSRACWMMPEVREQMLYDQQQATEAQRKAQQDAAYKAQQEKAASARKAATSLRPGSPGSQVGRQPAPEKGMSVRDSLKAAIADLSGR